MSISLCIGGSSQTTFSAHLVNDVIINIYEVYRKPFYDVFETFTFSATKDISDRDDETQIVTCDENDPARIGWSVFGQHSMSGCEVIADCDTKQEAELLHNALLLLVAPISKASAPETSTTHEELVREQEAQEAFIRG